jgi:hypothetical protein
MWLEKQKKEGIVPETPEEKEEAAKDAFDKLDLVGLKEIGDDDLEEDEPSSWEGGQANC